MRSGLLPLTLFTVLWATSAQAQTFDAGQCARIQGVELPYRVAVATDAITFNGRSGDIVVSAQSIRANGRLHQSPSVAGYHQKLSQFLTRADTMGREGLRAANPFANGGAGLGDAATNMCQAILDLAGSTAVIESEFNGYSSPVRIRLR
ncbi:MAG: hypothetical protein K2P58_05925 [Hyphomonadaceae bacterium]|nr:hypothetical protein [Hyphomonadaceae bacterium]